MINRLVGVEFTKKGNICFETQEDKRLSREYWMSFNSVMARVKELGIDIREGILI
ncbi:MAG: hypothetical protein RSC24_06760 [Clostridium sp.]